jgi:hypothetical protein
LLPLRRDGRKLFKHYIRSGTSQEITQQFLGEDYPSPFIKRKGHPLRLQISFEIERTLYVQCILRLERISRRCSSVIIDKGCQKHSGRRENSHIDGCESSFLDGLPSRQPARRSFSLKTPAFDYAKLCRIVNFYVKNAKILWTQQTEIAERRQFPRS